MIPADLREADLSGVDLSRAKLAIFKGTVGIRTVRGMETAEGRDEAIFDR